MKKISFDIAFKIIILIISAYLMCLLTVIAYNFNKIGDNSENGRYQLKSGEGFLIIDTKTGTTYYTNHNGSPIKRLLNEKPKP